MAHDIRKKEVDHALQVNRTTTKAFCKEIVKPNGKKGLSRTHWYAVLRGDRKSEWLEKLQDELVEDAKAKSPHTFRELYDELGVDGKLPTN
ncbi:MAG: hypothetical protein GVY20_02070 [Bacteroidetes bacterium]|jgi:hypothetical protein|nr:hypothetical protein [Bacteroidota bacterium]